MAIENVWSLLHGNVGNDFAAAVALSRDGHIYIAGNTEKGIDNPNPNGTSDVYLSKYNATGVKAWSRLLGASNLALGHSVTVANDGSIYLVGQISGGLEGEAAISLAQLFLAKYNSDGSRVWVKLLEVESPGNATATAVATDAEGAIYIAGGSTRDLNTMKYSSSSGLEYAAFLAKYESDGSKSWLQMLDSKASIANSIGVSENGFIYIAGQTNGDLGGQVNAGSADIFLAKYDKYGGRLWTQLYGSPSADIPESAAIAVDGGIYITGSTAGNLGGKQNSGGKEKYLAGDSFLLKFNPDGKHAWTQLLGSTAADVGKAVAVTKDGSVLVAGRTAGSLDGKLNNGGDNGFGSSGDAFIASYGVDGVKMWTDLIGSASYDSARSLAIAFDGSIYIAGDTMGDLNGSVNNGGMDAFLLKYKVRNTTPDKPSEKRTWEIPFSIADANRFGPNAVAYWLRDSKLTQQPISAEIPYVDVLTISPTTGPKFYFAIFDNVYEDGPGERRLTGVYRGENWTYIDDYVAVYRDNGNNVLDIADELVGRYDSGGDYGGLTGENSQGYIRFNSQSQGYVTNQADVQIALISILPGPNEVVKMLPVKSIFAGNPAAKALAGTLKALEAGTTQSLDTTESSEVKTLADLTASKPLTEEARKLLDRYTIKDPEATTTRKASDNEAGFIDFTLKTGALKSLTAEIQLASEVKATAYVKVNPNTGEAFDFTYDPITGLGAELLDTNKNGLVDTLRIHLQDGARGDADGLVNGEIRDPGVLAEAPRASVYRFYRNGVHFYTTSDAERDTVIQKSYGSSVSYSDLSANPQAKDPITGGWGYRFEGIAYQALDTQGTALYRFFSPSKGYHFVTTSSAEALAVIQNSVGSSYDLSNAQGQKLLDKGWGFQFEGNTYKVSTIAQTGMENPVYRFFNGQKGVHFYSSSMEETKAVIANSLGGQYATDDWVTSTASAIKQNPLTSTPTQVTGGWGYSFEGISWYV